MSDDRMILRQAPRRKADHIADIAGLFRTGFPHSLPVLHALEADKKQYRKADFSESRVGVRGKNVLTHCMNGAGRGMIARPGQTVAVFDTGGGKSGTLKGAAYARMRMWPGS